METRFLENLNEEQQKAVVHRDGPALVVAGPGSGKTRVLTHHAAYLTNTNLAKSQKIFLCTFTNKAANEMRERVSRLMKSGVTIPWSGTFHSLCSRLLRTYGSEFGVNPNFVIYDVEDAKAVIKKIIRETTLPMAKANPSAILSAISGAKNELVDDREYSKYAFGPFQKSVAVTFSLYQKILKENDAFDFDDLILKVVELLKNHPLFLKKIQKQFDHVLIDEYQDTNKSQYVLAKLIAGQKKNIYAVGDVSQAIYSFRGADFRNILNFERDFPEAKIYYLSQNYRSTKTIIEAAKAVIKNNKTHISLDLWTDNDGGGKVGLYEAANEMEEAHFVLYRLKEIKRLSPELQLKNFAVLYRTNAQSRVIEEAFLKEGVPYHLVGGTGFYERREIKDVLALLKTFLNPKEVISRERIEKIGKKRASVFLSFLDNFSERNEYLTKKGSLEILDLVLERSGYLLYLDDGSEEGSQRVENVKELRSVATSFENLTEFLENVSLIQQEYAPRGKMDDEEGEEGVSLMTLHAAKGLEFPVIFLVGMEEGILPHSRSLLDQNDLEEERRLCYVGLTRAMKEIYLTYTRQRLFFGAQSRNIVSRFVSEIPENLVRFESSVYLNPESY